MATILSGMTAHKLACLPLAMAVFVLPPAGALGSGDGSADTSLPVISERHRRFLSTVARRTMRDAILDRTAYEASYVPRALQSIEAEVVVRLRQRGYLLASGVGGPLPVAQAAGQAASVAVESLGLLGEDALSQVNQMLVEIEVVSPSQPIDTDADWTQYRAIDPYVEPGIHGFVFRAGGIQQRFCPTEIFTSDMVVAEALEAIAQQMKTIKSQIGDIELLRFRTQHWYEPSSAADIVSLKRGLTIIAQEAVTPEGVDQAIAALATYMAYRQLETGLFSYQYEPARDIYTEDNNLVRQAGAVAAMATHARWSGKSASRGAADLGLRYFLKGLTEALGQEHAAFIATPDQQHKLGVTALVCMAMAQHPQPQDYADTRRKLVNGMLWLQRPSGMFITAFPPAERIDAQEYFPGEALLAMAMDYEHKPSARVLDAFDRAIAFYRQYFRGRPSPAFVPWQVQAYALMARETKRDDYVEYVYELCDWLTDKQLTPANCDWPEMWGGIASYQEGRAGVATAAYLEGFADALTLARRAGDRERVARYEKVVRLATRFVMQLQIRPEEAYFIRSPRDAIGGIRTSPSLNLLRIDHCQHGLIGLIKAREALFSNRD